MSAVTRILPSLLFSDSVVNLRIFDLQVIFRNEQGGEYLFYYVTFKAVPPGVMATIDLSTPIRKSTSHVVTLHNPLSTPVTFNSQCSVADIQLPPSFTVPPLSEVSACLVLRYFMVYVSCDYNSLLYFNFRYGAALTLVTFRRVTFVLFKIIIVNVLVGFCFEFYFSCLPDYKSFFFLPPDSLSCLTKN